MTDKANSPAAKEQQVACNLAASLEQARRSELSTKTFEEIREGTKRHVETIR